MAYDGNGNILKYLRNGAGVTVAMDSLSYGYNLDANGYLASNRLRHVRDAIGDGNYTVDIDSQEDDNYEYDEIGNLVKDVKEGITNIEWTVYGKISKIEKQGGVTIRYTYDAAGNRISKAVIIGENTTTTWYSRDAQGNTLAVYEEKSEALSLTEQHLYGSDRLGLWSGNIGMNAGVPDADLERGNKFFELSNHLGNVLATISDRKIGVDSDSDGDIDFYLPDVVTATDYAPFGMSLVNRSFRASGLYRYGFNGKERDNDINSGSLDFGARIYDGRIGRWLSVDAYADKYPNVSPYTFCINSPLQFKDANGHWLTDANGNIIYTFGPITYEKSDDGKTLYEVGIYYFYTNDGQKVEAGRYRFKANMKDVEWDYEANWPKMTDQKGKVDILENSPENSNCHGNTLGLHTGDQYDMYIPGLDWTDGKDNVSKIFKNKSEFTPINAEDVKPGDIAIFEDGDGNIQHSATVTKVSDSGRKVKLTSKDDRKKARKNQTIEKIMENENYSKFAGYYRHNGNVNTGEKTVPSYPGLIDHDVIMDRILQEVKDGKIPKSNN